MGERVNPRPGPCLICGSENDPSQPDLPRHIKTEHTDVEAIAELMIQLGQLKNQVKTLHG